MAPVEIKVSCNNARRRIEAGCRAHDPCSRSHAGWRHWHKSTLQKSCTVVSAVLALRPLHSAVRHLRAEPATSRTRQLQHQHNGAGGVGVTSGARRDSGRKRAHDAADRRSSRRRRREGLKGRHERRPSSAGASPGYDSAERSVHFQQRPKGLPPGERRRRAPAGRQNNERRGGERTLLLTPLRNERNGGGEKPGAAPAVCQPTGLTSCRFLHRRGCSKYAAPVVDSQLRRTTTRRTWHHLWRPGERGRQQRDPRHSLVLSKILGGRPYGIY